MRWGPHYIRWNKGDHLEPRAGSMTSGMRVAPRLQEVVVNLPCCTISMSWKVYCWKFQIWLLITPRKPVS